MKVDWRMAVPQAVIAMALMIGGCNQIQGLTNKVSGGGNNPPGEGPAVAAPDSETASRACVMRVTLDTLLQENVVLSVQAADAALGGRADEFTSAQAVLGKNTVDLSHAISNVYDQGTADAFLALWQKHDQYILDYAAGLAANDQNKQDKATEELEQFTQDFGAFMEQATNGKLAKDAVAEMVKNHVYGIKTLIDAQAAKKFDDAYSKERVCEQDAQTLGNMLADAFVAQFPGKF